MLSKLNVHKKKFLAVVALACVMAAGLGVREALSADADLQQYNGSAVWANDLTAASTLLPRDGKRITADSNAVGSAPVNRSLKQIKDYLVAVHEGVFGIGAATRRTVKSLEADGTGGNVSTLLAGGIASTSMSNRSLMTPTDVAVFGIGPTAGQTLMNKGAIVFTNTADGGGNPARTSAVSNKLIPLNTVKAWVNAETDGMGAVTIRDGHNITSCTVIDNITVDCALAINLDDTNGMALASTQLGHDVKCELSAVNTLHCSFGDRGAMTLNCQTGGGLNKCVFNVALFGRKTT